jgi:hypothetical protein
VFNAPPDKESKIDRLPPPALEELRKNLHVSGFVLADGPTAAEELHRLRALYEPYAQSLAGFLHLELPPWIKGAVAKDNWQTTAWQLGQQQPAKVPAHEEHG